MSIFHQILDALWDVIDRIQQGSWAVVESIQQAIYYAYIWILEMVTAAAVWAANMLPAENSALARLIDSAGTWVLGLGNYMAMANYFIHLPAIATILAVILLVEAVVHVFFLYKFVKSLIPMA